MPRSALAEKDSFVVLLAPLLSEEISYCPFCGRPMMFSYGCGEGLRRVSCCKPAVRSVPQDWER